MQNKTRLGLFLIVLLSVQFDLIKAQSLSLGVKAGAGLSKVKVINIDGFGPDFVPSFGSTFSCAINAVLDFSLKSSLSLLVEPGFITKGYTYQNSFDTGEFSVKQNHLQLPVLLKLNVFKGCFIDVGYELSYYMSTNLSSRDEYFNVAGEKKFELSFLGGLGYDINNQISFGLRFNRGVSSLASLVDVSLDDIHIFWIKQPKMYNKYSQFYIKYDLS